MLDLYHNPVTILLPDGVFMSQPASPALPGRVRTERHAPTDMTAATGVNVHADGLDSTVAMVRGNIVYLKRRLLCFLS